MSYGSWGVNDAMAVKKWAMEVADAERDSLDIFPLIGDGDDSIIHRRRETEKGKGDKVTFSLRARPTQKGIGSSSRAEGNAESLSIYSDSILIDEMGANFGAPSEYTIDAQRVPFNLREQCKNANRDWWVDRLSKTFFNHVCGYTPANTESATSGLLYTGLNPVTAPAVNTNITGSGIVRQIWQGSAGADESLGNSDTFTLGLIDRAVEAAKTGNSMIRPIMIAGKPHYVMYLHTSQVTALKTSTSGVNWYESQRFAYMGKEKDNPIFTGALGEYNNVILRSSQDVTPGVNSSTGASVSNTRRAVLLGAQACVCAYGTKYTEGRRYRWSEELLDHSRLLEVATFSIWGLKKAVFNGNDHGCLVVSTYASS